MTGVYIKQCKHAYGAYHFLSAVRTETDLDSVTDSGFQHTQDQQPNKEREGWKEKEW